MEANKKDPTRRFSDRVKDYSRYRPGYPAEVFESLTADLNLDSHSIIADIGAGTGLLTEKLLSTTAHVVAVEPNQEMRAACDQRLTVQPKYSSTAGTAEDTGLAGHSVDLITAAQAFHWFSLKESFS